MIWATLLVAAAVAAPTPPAPAAISAAPEPAKAEPPKAPEPPREAATPEMYAAAVSAHAAGERARAAALLFRWISAAPRADVNYDLAQHLLADDLAALGLSHAAIAREAEVARTRARPELLAEALERLERWTSTTPHDDTRVEDELVHGTDFGPLSGASGAWVAYHQGALDLKAGDERWARLRFDAIPAGSPYRARAKLLLAANALGAAKDDEVLAQFEELGQDRDAPAEVRNEAHTEAGRLRFERGDYTLAMKHFEAIDLPELDAGRGQLYLEEAWIYYRTGDGGRAMGLLAALEAPSFRHLFLPEKQLLRAFLYKDACQLLPAKQAARDLRRRFRASLEAIDERRPLVEDPALAAAALEKGAGRRADLFVARLEQERDHIAAFSSEWNAGGLDRQLAAFYEDALGEARRRRLLALERGVARAADELLRAHEQAGLVDYEVGLALYRRERGNDTPPNLAFQADAPGAGEVAYEFDGEYWNDELLDLRLVLVNRCREGARP